MQILLSVIFAILATQPSFGANSKETCADILSGWTGEELSLSQVQKAMYGKNPLQPSPESWLGKYIAETGAKTLVRKFPKGPDFPDQFGDEKLVVAVSTQSLDAYKKYFSRPEILQHLHTPRQGTLVLQANGKVGSYGQMSHELRDLNAGSIVPTILLSTTEALRAQRFFNLATSNQNLALNPWLMRDYCATGGYNSCTHWVANIPLGDKMVDRYIFPGRVDQYAGNNVTPGPQEKPLAAYETTDENAKKVWQVPGHMQLWEVLDIYDAQVGGYLANPGWVAHVLSAWVKVNRVPVVFYVVPDHTSPIDENFPLNINPI